MELILNRKEIEQAINEYLLNLGIKNIQEINWDSIYSGILSIHIKEIHKPKNWDNGQLSTILLENIR